MIEKARQILGVNINWTGKLGVRTKYQKFKVAQLTIEMDKKGVPIFTSKPNLPIEQGNTMSKKTDASTINFPESEQQVSNKEVLQPESVA